MSLAEPPESCLARLSGVGLVLDRKDVLPTRPSASLSESSPAVTSSPLQLPPSLTMPPAQAVCELRPLLPLDVSYVDTLLCHLRSVTMGVIPSDERDRYSCSTGFAWEVLNGHKGRRMVGLHFPGGRDAARSYFDCDSDGAGLASLRSIVCFMGSRKAVQHAAVDDASVVGACWAR